ncbi:DivIVA domain-containing protein [Nocardiopsis coralliicola]
MPLTPADIRKKRFSTVRFRPGYNEDDVDALLDRAEETLAALDGGPADGAWLTAEDIEASRFRGTRLLPGYNEDEVDEFLDEIARDLRARGLSRRGDIPDGAAPPASPAGPETWSASRHRAATGPVPIVGADPPPGADAPRGAPGAGGTPAMGVRGTLTPAGVRNKSFSTTRLTTGYNEEEVDDFLDAAEGALSAHIDGSSAAPPLTAAEVERVRFSTTRARPGYDPAQVDAFLDLLAEELRTYER